MGAPWPVWTGAENLAPTGIRSPDRPARSQLLYRIRYPAHFILGIFFFEICRTNLTLCKSGPSNRKALHINSRSHFPFLLTVDIQWVYCAQYEPASMLTVDIQWVYCAQYEPASMKQLTH